VVRVVLGALDVTQANKGSKQIKVRVTFNSPDALTGRSSAPS
jgi:hypothetical protein